VTADSARYSFRHPRTGEWAHNLAHSLQEESWHTYLEPAWDYLHKQTVSVLQVVEVGFGRGFNTAELLRRASTELPEKRLEVTAFEPHPDRLLPWPDPPAELSNWMPWWGEGVGDFASDDGTWNLSILPHMAQQLDFWPQSGVHLVILDLFSPARHPEQWSQPLIANISAKAARNAQLCSYCCARSVREQLSGHGWDCRILKSKERRDSLHAVFKPDSRAGDARMDA